MIYLLLFHQGKSNYLLLSFIPKYYLTNKHTIFDACYIS